MTVQMGNVRIKFTGGSNKKEGEIHKHDGSTGSLKLFGSEKLTPTQLAAALNTKLGLTESNLLTAEDILALDKIPVDTGLTITDSNDATETNQSVLEYIIDLALKTDVSDSIDPASQTEALNNIKVAVTAVADTDVISDKLKGKIESITTIESIGSVDVSGSAFDSSLKNWLGFIQVPSTETKFTTGVALDAKISAWKATGEVTDANLLTIADLTKINAATDEALQKLKTIKKAVKNILGTSPSDDEIIAILNKFIKIGVLRGPMLNGNEMTVPSDVGSDKTYSVNIKTYFGDNKVSVGELKSFIAQLPLIIEGYAYAGGKWNSPLEMITTCLCVDRDNADFVTYKEGAGGLKEASNDEIDEAKETKLNELSSGIEKVLKGKTDSAAVIAALNKNNATKDFFTAEEKPAGTIAFSFKTDAQDNQIDTFTVKKEVFEKFLRLKKDHEELLFLDWLEVQLQMEGKGPNVGVKLGSVDSTPAATQEEKPGIAADKKKSKSTVEASKEKPELDKTAKSSTSEIKNNVLKTNGYTKMLNNNGSLVDIPKTINPADGETLVLTKDDNSLAVFKYQASGTSFQPVITSEIGKQLNAAESGKTIKNAINFIDANGLADKIWVQKDSGALEAWATAKDWTLESNNTYTFYLGSDKTLANAKIATRRIPVSKAEVTTKIKTYFTNSGDAQPSDNLVASIKVNLEQVKKQLVALLKDTTNNKQTILKNLNVLLPKIATNYSKKVAFAKSILEVLTKDDLKTWVKAESQQDEILKAIGKDKVKALLEKIAPDGAIISGEETLFYALCLNNPRAAATWVNKLKNTDKAIAIINGFVSKFQDSNIKEAVLFLNNITASAILNRFAQINLFEKSKFSKETGTRNSLLEKLKTEV